MDRAAFFKAVRPTLFGGSLSGDQVKGIETVLDEWNKSGQKDSRWLAYILATAHHETGAKFVASIENLNYSVDGLLKTFGRHRISEADARKYGRSGSRPANQSAIANLIYGGTWGRDNLGNTQPADGWNMRGRGLVQITGRANYAKYGLTDNPHSAADIDVAARVAVDGMVNGRFTGKRLSDYFDGDSDDPVGARKIINPDSNGADIAVYHRKYLAALKAAGA
jgi:putative chitinase